MMKTVLLGIKRRRLAVCVAVGGLVLLTAATLAVSVALSSRQPAAVAAAMQMPDTKLIVAAPSEMPGETPLTLHQLAEIGDVIAAFERADRDTCVIPQDAQGVVEERLAEIRASDAKPVEEGQPFVHVLPYETHRQMEAAWRSAVERYCTSGYAKDLLALDPVSDTELALFNNAQAAPNVAIDWSALTVKQVGVLDRDPILWVMAWSRVTQAHHDRPQGESWSVCEYRVQEENGAWRIADVESLFHCDDASKTEWGPATPHQDVADGEWTGGYSVLYPGAPPPREELADLD